MFRPLCVSPEAVWTGLRCAGDGGTAERSAGHLSLLADLQLHRLLLLRPRLLQPDAPGRGNSVEVCEQRKVGRGERSDTGTVERVPLVDAVADLAVGARGTGQATGDHAVRLLLCPPSQYNDLHQQHSHHQPSHSQTDWILPGYTPGLIITGSVVIIIIFGLLSYLGILCTLHSTYGSTIAFSISI